MEVENSSRARARARSRKEEFCELAQNQMQVWVLGEETSRGKYVNRHVQQHRIIE